MSPPNSAAFPCPLLLELLCYAYMHAYGIYRVFCVEAVAFPVSNPSSPGVPFRTFHDPSAKRSAARGVLVNPVDGDVDQRGASGISAAGLPSYTSSMLPIRFTNVRLRFFFLFWGGDRERRRAEKCDDHMQMRTSRTVCAATAATIISYSSTTRSAPIAHSQNGEMSSLVRWYLYLWELGGNRLLSTREACIYRFTSLV